MQTTSRTALAIGLAAMCAVGLTAQTQETKTTKSTKVEIKDGKDTTVTGCLERRPNGDYTLRVSPDKIRPEPLRYALVTDDDLSKHVGESVEIKGKAAVNGQGTVSTDSRTRTEVENGQDSETRTRTEGTAGALDLPLLGVSSLKKLASSCT
jgi:hypothetical protein